MFRASYSEEIQYFINDNDTLVRLKGITTCAKLMCHKLIQTTYFESDVWPAWLKLIESGFDEDQSMHFFSKSFGQFLHNVN